MSTGAAAPSGSRRFAGAERTLQLLLRFYVALFGAGAVLFLVFAKPVVQVLDDIGSRLGMQPLDASYAQLWIPLAVAYMVLVMELSWTAQKDPSQNLAVGLLILAKATSAVLALAYLVLVVHAFAFLVNFVVGGAIALATYLLHRQAAAELARPA